VVNDRADVALAAGADGVHLRSDGPLVADVRGLASEPGPWIVGRSVHGVSDAHDHDDADYLLFGTVFAGGSKGEAVPPQGLESLAHAAAASRAPVLAIGGVTPARTRALMAAGAAGVAAIGAFVALGPARAAKAFREAFAP
jgi:thiamine-phosphate diphosphorylase